MELSWQKQSGSNDLEDMSMDNKYTKNSSNTIKLLHVYPQDKLCTSIFQTL